MRRLRARPAVATISTAMLFVSLVTVPAAHADETLPLGDTDLTETRSAEKLADGVTLTRIVRGTEPADEDEIATTPRGPWKVNVLDIDPDVADGSLRSTVGPDIAKVEPTTELVDHADALAGVNASFFTFTASEEYPGDPVGFSAQDGTLLSEPTTDAAEADMVIRDNDVLLGKLTWKGQLRNRHTGATLPLEFVNHPPVVPEECADQPDQTQCTADGDVVRFTPEFAASTPTGHGVELVLDRRGCVVKSLAKRGTKLHNGQTSVQATGVQSKELLDVVGQDCVRSKSTVTDENGKKLHLKRGVYGVNGRYQLTEDGKIVVPDRPGDDFFERNPRTIAGTTGDGTIKLVTIDGRQTDSVGTTMAETAEVARALGLRDAINLDGGGSTTMVANDAVVNDPSGGSQREVGDALVWVP